MYVFIQVKSQYMIEQQKNRTTYKSILHKQKLMVQIGLYHFQIKNK